MVDVKRKKSFGIWHLACGRCMAYLFGIFIRSNGLHNGSLLFINSKLHPHAGKRRQNIRKQDTSIRLIVSPWLERNFDGHFWYFRSLSKRGILLAQIPIFLDMTTCLSHHPNWSAFDSLTTSSANQEWVFGTTTVIPIGGGGSRFCRIRAEESRSCCVILQGMLLGGWIEGR